MNKGISKAILLRTKLRNKLLKYPTIANRISHSKQRNFLCYEKKKFSQYFLNVKNMTSNKKNWQTIKPFLSEKAKSREKIALLRNEKLVSYNTEVANCLTNFFSNIIKNVEIPKDEVKDNFHQNIESPTLKAVLKYRNHPSIVSLTHSFYQASSFSFSCIQKKNKKNKFKRN